jgi:uncharacterized protein with PIN domain
VDDLKFLADGMLGKLTRWLRMLGHDVVYTGSMNDNELILKAKKENRILLTRDVQLYQRAIAKGAEAFLLESPNQITNLAQAAGRFKFPLEINPEISRCPKCNTKIRPILKTEAARKIPEKTLVHYDDFWQCPNCQQVYWRGAHWKKIEQTLIEAQKTLEGKG